MLFISKSTANSVVFDNASDKDKRSLTVLTMTSGVEARVGLVRGVVDSTEVRRAAACTGTWSNNCPMVAW